MCHRPGGPCNAVHSYMSKVFCESLIDWIMRLWLVKYKHSFMLHKNINICWLHRMLKLLNVTFRYVNITSYKIDINLSVSLFFFFLNGTGPGKSIIQQSAVLEDAIILSEAEFQELNNLNEFKTSYRRKYFEMCCQKDVVARCQTLVDQFRVQLIEGYEIDWLEF